MNDKLIEVRCPYCPPIVRGALLFKAQGDAVIETKCTRCGAIVKIIICNYPKSIIKWERVKIKVA